MVVLSNDRGLECETWNHNDPSDQYCSAGWTMVHGICHLHISQLSSVMLLAGRLEAL